MPTEPHNMLNRMGDPQDVAHAVMFLCSEGARFITGQTLVVDGGGLQRKTVTSILMAWVFTLPAAIILSGVLYWLSLKLI